MTDQQMDNSPLERLIAEVKRRYLFRAAGLYAGAAFVLLQLADVVLPGLGIADSYISYLLISIAAGFPVTMFVVWMLDLGGDRTQVHGRAMDAVIVVLALGVGFLYLERLVSPSEEGVTVQSQAASDGTSVVAVSPLPKQVVLNNSIAVLPFENLSPDPDNAYFAAGIHEEVLNQLAKIEDLSVIARTSMLRYAGTDKLVQEIAGELNVGAVMEGSVRFAGNRVRVTAQLNDGVNGVHLWSETYDRDLDDVFSIQSDIALRITDAMKVEYSLDEQQAIARQPTSNPEAFAHFVKGQALITAADPDLVGGTRELERATTLDPGYAEAWAMRSLIHGFLLSFWQPGVPRTQEFHESNLQMAQEFAETALEQDSRQALAHLALSLVQETRRQWDAAYESARRAQELQPSSSFISFIHGRWLLRHGQVERALQVFHRTIALDPLNHNLPRFIGLSLFDAGEFSLARQFLEQARAMEPDQAEPYMGLALIAGFENNLEEVEMLLPQVELRMREDEREANVQVFIWLYTLTGNQDKLDDWLGVYEDLLRQGKIVSTQRAVLAAIRGDASTAMAELNLMVDQNFPSFGQSILHFHPDSAFAGFFKHDPAFQDLLGRIAKPVGDG